MNWSVRRKSVSVVMKLGVKIYLTLLGDRASGAVSSKLRWMESLDSHLESLGILVKGPT